jgi:hypothetical protein
VLARLSRILIVIALAGSIGLQWAFLQAVAWTGMVISYSQDASWREAVAKTFDGKHPCNLCRRIAEGKKSEKFPEARVDIVKKFEFQYSPQSFIVAAPTYFLELRPVNAAADSWTAPPPVPPPRRFPV